MKKELKGKIFNEDIKIIETSSNYTKAFELIEKENQIYKDAVLKNIRNSRYIYS